MVGCLLTFPTPTFSYYWLVRPLVIADILDLTRSREIDAQNIGIPALIVDRDVRLAGGRYVHHCCHWYRQHGQRFGSTTCRRRSHSRLWQSGPVAQNRRLTLQAADPVRGVSRFRQGPVFGPTATAERRHSLKKKPRSDERGSYDGA